MRAFVSSVDVVTFFSLSDLAALIRYIRPFLNNISKAKSAKLVRNLLDLFLEVDATTDTAVSSL